jgi:hypothetical protein
MKSCFDFQQQQQHMQQQITKLLACPTDQHVQEHPSDNDKLCQQP